jgi:WD40 repeat protein
VLDSAPVPKLNVFTPEVSLNGRFLADRIPTSGALIIYQCDQGNFTQRHQIDDFPNYRNHSPSPDGNYVWGYIATFSASNARPALFLNRKRFTNRQPDQKHEAIAWVDNEHLVEAVDTDGTLEKEGVSQQLLVLWNVNKSNCIAEATAPDVLAVCASPDGMQIAEGGLDMKVRIRNGRTLAVEREVRVHDGAVRDIAWNPRLPLLCTLSDDRTVKIWDLGTDEQVECYRFLQGMPEKVCWSPDGSALAFSFPGRRSVSILLPPVCGRRSW